MQTEEALEIFRRTGVMQEGHFKLTSGRHSDRYMQCARLFQYPEDSVRVCADVAAAFRNRGVTVVAGPALGGIIMAYEVARILGVRNVFAERENGTMTLRRGFDVSAGERALVVEDVVTTGGSVKEVIKFLRACGAEVVGVASVVDRSNGSVDFGVMNGGSQIPFHAVATMSVESWEADACPLCRQGLPIVKPGSRK
ncbi:MAG: orotate phosphoribosyltransferase [Synergistaceae bacterium]|jgi:orotate phosphoribosyltransferase|nr:orotate phosphoribosyltransferase [Synergistaceae bacterium]